MNKLGVSSSCFYPQPTEKSFEKICRSGVRAAEIFYNSESELTDSFSKEMYAMQNAAGVDVISVHTYTGFADSFNLFTDYERRFYDGIEIYKRLANTAAGYNAKYVVMHGAKAYHTVCDEELCERFRKLAETVASFGVMLCYENVNSYRSERPEFLKMMMDATDGTAGTVLDVKQARRAKVPYIDFINILGSNIKHIHISDYDDDFDCTTPLTGKFDFGNLFSSMTDIGYNGAYIIELYKQSYKTEEDIINSYNLLIEKFNNLC